MTSNRTKDEPEEINIRCDMNMDASLRILRQDDGDFLLQIKEKRHGQHQQAAGIEICTISHGGGKHREFYNLLAKYWAEHFKYAQSYTPSGNRIQNAAKALLAHNHGRDYFMNDVEEYNYNKYAKAVLDGDDKLRAVDEITIRKELREFCKDFSVEPILFSINDIINLMRQKGYTIVKSEEEK